MNSVVSTTSSVVVVVEVSDVVVLDDSVVWGWSAGTSEEPSPSPELPNTQMTNATMPTTTAAPMTAGNFQLLFSSSYGAVDTAGGRSSCPPWSLWARPS